MDLANTISLLSIKLVLWPYKHSYKHSSANLNTVNHTNQSTGPATKQHRKYWKIDGVKRWIPGYLSTILRLSINNLNLIEDYDTHIKKKDQLQLTHLCGWLGCVIGRQISYTTIFMFIGQSHFFCMNKEQYAILVMGLLLMAHQPGAQHIPNFFMVKK